MAYNHARLSERNGAEFLDRDRGLDNLLPDHNCRELAQPAAPRERIGRARLLANRAPTRTASSLVSKARGSGDCGAGSDWVAKYCFQIGEILGLDIRLPIGFLFSLFGVLLITYGTFSDRSIYDRSLNININLEWGIVMLVFGAIMLALGRHRSKA